LVGDLFSGGFRRKGHFLGRGLVDVLLLGGLLRGDLLLSFLGNGLDESLAELPESILAQAIGALQPEHAARDREDVHDRHHCEYVPDCFHDSSPCCSVCASRRCRMYICVPASSTCAASARSWACRHSSWRFSLRRSTALRAV